MITYFQTISPSPDIGAYYNKCMAMIPDGEWGCFIDADAMILPARYAGKLMEDIVKKYPEIGMFGAYTNRVNNKEQLIEGYWDDFNMCNHHELGKALQDEYNTECVEARRPVSGVLMLVNKKAWKQCGFPEGSFFGVDNNFNYYLLNRGWSVKLMKGIYCYHWYRGPAMEDDDHLKYKQGIG